MLMMLAMVELIALLYMHTVGNDRSSSKPFPADADDAPPCRVAEIRPMMGST